MRTVVVLLVVFGCGCPGAPGRDGSSCRVSIRDGGGSTLSCTDGTSIDINDGRPGSSCTVEILDGGSKLISCADGTSAVVRDGAPGSSCSVSRDGGLTRILCADGTSVTLPEPPQQQGADGGLDAGGDGGADGGAGAPTDGGAGEGVLWGQALLPGQASHGGTLVRLNQNVATTDPDGGFLVSGVSGLVQSLELRNGRFRATVKGVLLLPGSTGFVIDGEVRPFGSTMLQRGAQVIEQPVDGPSFIPWTLSPAVSRVLVRPGTLSTQWYVVDTRDGGIQAVDRALSNVRAIRGFDRWLAEPEPTTGSVITVSEDGTTRVLWPADGGQQPILLSSGVVVVRPPADAGAGLVVINSLDGGRREFQPTAELLTSSVEDLRVVLKVPDAGLQVFDPSTDIVQLVSTELPSGLVALSGPRVVFVSDLRGLVVAPGDGGMPVPLAALPATLRTVSQDGTRVIFSSSNGFRSVAINGGPSVLLDLPTSQLLDSRPSTTSSPSLPVGHAVLARPDGTLVSAALDGSRAPIVLGRSIGGALFVNDTHAAFPDGAGTIVTRLSDGASTRIGQPFQLRYASGTDRLWLCSVGPTGDSKVLDLASNVVTPVGDRCGDGFWTESGALMTVRSAPEMPHRRQGGLYLVDLAP